MSGSTAQTTAPTPLQDSDFEDAGAAWDIDPNLLRAQHGVEDPSGNPTATSPKGAQGQMQIMPATGAALGVTDPTNSRQNVFAAAKLMRQNLDQYGNVPDALRAYNAGTDQSKWGNKETTAYVPGVLSRYTQLASANTGTQSDASPDLATPPPDPGTALLDKYGLTAPANSNSPAAAPATAPAASPGPAADPGAALLAKYGLGAPDAPATAATAPPSTAIAAPTNAQDQSPRYGADGGLLVPENAIDATGDTVLPGIRNALAPAPNTTYGQILPFAKDNTTGAMRLALPNSLRNLAEGGLDLAEGPATGTVTPAAAMTLASGLVPGAMGGRMAADAADAVAPDAARVMPPPVNALAAPDAAVTTNALAPRPVPMAVASDPAAVAPNALATPPSAVPASMGAAASRDGTNPLAANFTDPREAAASRATGNAYRMSQGATVGKDATVYVPGYQPTLADISGNAAVSGMQKATLEAAGNQNWLAQRNIQNNAALIDHFDNQAGTPTTLNTLKQARSTQAQGDLDTAWANKGTADPQPVLDTVAGIMAGPDGVRPAIQTAMSNVTKTLTDAQGNPQTDPQMLYGARKAIDDAMSKAGQADTPLNSRIVSNLQQVKDSLDPVITAAAPDFSTYLQNFAAASKPIDTQTLLQSMRPDLLDAQGNMQLSRVNSMMKQITSAQAAPGIDPAKSIDQDTMDNLFNLRQQLLQQGNRSLGKPSGSDTNLLGQYGAKMGTGAAHLIAGHLLPGIGNLAVHYGTDVLSNSLASKSLAKRTNALLNPDLTAP